jgi:hypothetical protein
MFYNDMAPTRARCLFLGRALVQHGLIEPLTSDEVFDDRYILFSFTSKPPPVAPPPPPPPRRSDDEGEPPETPKQDAHALIANFGQMLSEDDTSRGDVWAALAEAEAARRRRRASRRRTLIMIRTEAVTEIPLRFYALTTQPSRRGSSAVYGSITVQNVGRGGP